MPIIESGKTIDEIYWDHVRSLSPTERFARVFFLFGTHYRSLAYRMKDSHPELTEREMRIAIARRVYGGDPRTVNLIEQSAVIPAANNSFLHSWPKERVENDSNNDWTIMDISLKELAELAVNIGEVLTNLEIRFFLTGGVVAAYYGEQRMTQDVDMVIDLAGCEKKTTELLFHELEKRFMLARQAFDEAVSNNRMFQALDLKTMLRADIYVGGMQFERFERAVSAEIVPGIPLPIASPEDSILSKLVWIKMGSGRSKQDVVSILRIQTDLETEYLERTAKELGVEGILAEMRGIVERNDPNEIY